MRPTRWLAIVLVVSASGCMSGFDETHYFRSTTTDPNGIPVNYFRLHVNGGTILSSSRYLSGFFDEQALDTYFNEFAQPAGGRLTPATQPASADVEPIGTNLQNKKLLLILSSNSDDIATQIGALAQSDAVTTGLEHLLGQNKLAAARKTKATQQKDKAIATSIVQEGATEIEALDENAPPPDLNARMTEYANRLAAYLGSGQSLANLQQASDWAHANGSRAVVKEMP
jgi:hypothetical protein